MLPVGDQSEAIADLVDRFEGRSWRLKCWASVFLIIAFLLLVVAIAAVIYAPNLTEKDVRFSASVEDRLKAAIAEKDSAANELRVVDNQIETNRESFRKSLSNFFSPWEARGTQDPDDHTMHQVAIGCDPLPSGQYIAANLFQRVTDTTLVSQKIVGIELRICGSVISLRLSVPDYVEIQSELSNPGALAFQPTDELLSRYKKLLERLELARAVQARVYEQKVAQLAGGQPELLPRQEGDGDLFARLIQTSVTRFGLLAVIGFFVGILVSLYRYNIRLSAFYLARADLFLVSGGNLTVSDAVVLLGSLTPSLEFGKSPQLPLIQIAELLKGAKP